MTNFSSPSWPGSPNNPVLHPSWVANIQKYGPEIVNIVTVINRYNDKLWTNETEFYRLVLILANGWNNGINLVNACYTWIMVISTPYWVWDIGGQWLMTTAPYIGYLGMGTTTVPNMRPGFSAPATSTAITNLCVNDHFRVYPFTPTPIVVPKINIYGRKMNSLTNLPIGGWVMFLFNSDGSPYAPQSSAATDGNGYYSFTNLPVGTYVVGERNLGEWICDSPGYPPQYTVSSSVSANFTRDFANHVPPDTININGRKTNSTTGLPIPGWVMFLFDSNGTLYATSTADANGYYAFTNLPVGTYVVGERNLGDWICDSPGYPPQYTVSSSVSATFTRNFANHIHIPIPVININGKKLNSITKLPISGWTIYLVDTNGILYYKITDANGYYEWKNLPIGTYVLSEENRSGWVCTLPGQNTPYTITSAVSQTFTRNFENYIPTPVIAHAFVSNQTWDMDMRLQKTFVKTYTQSIILKKPFESSYTLSGVFRKDMTKTSAMSMRLSKDLEKLMRLDMSTLKNDTKTYVLDTKIVLEPRKIYTLSMDLLKTVEFSHLMYLNVQKEVGFSQTMDMELVHVPHRSWVVPQHWNLQTVEELATNSTGTVFDSRNDTDRKAAGVV